VRRGPDVSPPVPDNSALLTALHDHNETLKADVARLEAQLAASEARADRAIGAFAGLAERLDVLAAERERRPWWRRRPRPRAP